MNRSLKEGLGLLVTVVCIIWADCSFSASSQRVLTWEAPVSNRDGSKLTDLAGYRIYRGKTAETVHTHVVQLGLVQSVPLVSLGLEMGKHFLGIAAYNTLGSRSEMSNIIEVTVTKAEAKEGAKLVKPRQAKRKRRSRKGKAKKSGRPDMHQIAYSINGQKVATHNFGTQKKSYMASADYDGDGRTDFAIVRRAGSHLEWIVRDAASGKESTVVFGHAKDKPIIGCHFDSDRMADKATLGAKGLVVLLSSTGETRVVEIALPRKIKDLSCGDVDGDGVDELLLYTKEEKTKNKNKTKDKNKIRNKDKQK